MYADETVIVNTRNTLVETVGYSWDTGAVDEYGEGLFILK